MWRFIGSDLHFRGVFGRSCPFRRVPVMFHDTQHPDSFLGLAKKAQGLIQGSSKTCKLSIFYCKPECPPPPLPKPRFFILCSAPLLHSSRPRLKNGLTLLLFSQGPLAARQGQAGPLSKESCILSHLPFVFCLNLNFKLSPFNQQSSPAPLITPFLPLIEAFIYFSPGQLSCKSQFPQSGANDKALCCIVTVPQAYV